jgi:hypothetical protein
MENGKLVISEKPRSSNKRNQINNYIRLKPFDFNLKLLLRPAQHSHPGLKPPGSTNKKLYNSSPSLIGLKPITIRNFKDTALTGTIHHPSFDSSPLVPRVSSLRRTHHPRKTNFNLYEISIHNS